MHAMSTLAELEASIQCSPVGRPIYGYVKTPLGYHIVFDYAGGNSRITLMVQALHTNGGYVSHRAYTGRDKRNKALRGLKIQYQRWSKPEVDALYRLRGGG